jgi:3-hydroxypropanoate dehydrogenase
MTSNTGPVQADALDLIFRQGRTFSTWTSRPVDMAVLRQAYELAALGPTSMNGQPARFVLLASPESRERLLPCLAPPNVEKTRNAPCTVIVASDSRFHEHLPRLFHHRPGMRELYANNPSLAQETAHRNATLTAAYFICALRGLGVDCGPMSGFDAKAVNQTFFPSGEWQSEFLLNVGYGDRSSLFPRLPRLEWAEAWQEL